MSVLLAYRSALAALAVGGLFTFAADYLFAVGLVSFPPLYPILALVVLSVPLLFAPGFGETVLRAPLLWWIGFYAAVLILSFLHSSRSEVAYQVLQTHVLSLLTLLALLLVFADSRVHRAAQVFLLVAVLFGVVLNLCELFVPGAFSGVPGRAAGLYSNPNISGAALILGMILTAARLGPRWRHVFVLLVGLGVILTFSRTAVLGWLLVLGILVWLGELGVRRLLRLSLIGAVLLLGLLIVSGRWEAVVRAPASVATQGERLGIGIRYGVSTEFSARERIEVAEAAWAMFARHPVTGAGLGATSEWSLRAAPHNIYLQHLAEFGFLGLVLFPSFIVAVVWRGRKGFWASMASLAAFLAVWGTTSHNVLDERPFLIAVALAAAMGRAQSLEAGDDAAG